MQPINEIHTLQIKLEHRFALDLCPNLRVEFEDPREAGDSTVRDLRLRGMRMAIQRGAELNTVERLLCLHLA